MRRGLLPVWTLLGAWACSAGPVAALQDDAIPQFGRDTVLVWKIENQEDVSRFVIRIADFAPERFFEWENATTQGTIRISSEAVERARAFVNARLFEGGSDTHGKDSITLWLSRQAFENLKTKGKVKLRIDSLDGWMTLEGTERLEVEVNRSPRSLPVIIVKDSRGSERWFLDLEENPLMVRHVFRAYSKTLTSITTDRANTLRWIKGRKLKRP